MQGQILITGGVGTLGQAIVRTARSEKWDCTFTIYSRDPYKHLAMKREFPECRYVLGDVCDRDGLAKVAIGHDVIIHAAANKHIPECERQPFLVSAINITGSVNVLEAAVSGGVKQVIAISTDKVCHPVNVYGATKMLMERIFQDFALSKFWRGIKVNLCRYGNVLGSNGSVLQVWAQQAKSGETLKITDPSMSRFWLTEGQAVKLIEFASNQPSGTVTIPKIRACTMGALAEALYPGAPKAVIGLRPGEKMYEELLTAEESLYAEDHREHFTLWPSTMTRMHNEPFPYTSQNCAQLTADDIREMVKA